MDGKVFAWFLIKALIAKIAADFLLTTEAIVAIAVGRDDEERQGSFSLEKILMPTYENMVRYHHHGRCPLISIEFDASAFGQQRKGKPMPKGISDGPLCAAAVPRNPNGVSNTANDFVCYRKYGGEVFNFSRAKW
ncbi:hypothetical protein OUZ56_007085 [Daphnia magna]|uniref:Uncharacterized protein n=1 Tax=Daphnia magna TaxID=35525 RepID=A0ABQ9YXJ2_9CRUS|nr:hypothetical protein OUZ56_007085 [Daphnia magna]